MTPSLRPAGPRSPDAAPSPGLCAGCLHADIVVSGRGSTFYRCTLADVDERFVRYPRLPVRSCPGWLPDPREPGPGHPGGPGRKAG